MQIPNSPIINAKELLQLKPGENLVLIDARSGTDAKEKYMREHLQNALFVDLNKQLADIKPDLADGGRHPLPDPEKFSMLVQELGIDPDSHVVIYDDKYGSNAAARFWWMLTAIGHVKVQVLDGGFEAALKAGFPSNSLKTNPSPGISYNSQSWKLPAASLHEVEAAAGRKEFIVIDVREKYRYDGESEPIDLIAGHIPGAVNIPFTSNLDESGLFLSPSELRQKYLTALHEVNPENVIVHCGSGVTACHTLLAMAYAGLTIPKLYTGSWSEWSRNNMPIATNKVK
ncbi:MAG: sulfurtransferase [Ginsengibacter sp.]